MQTSLWSSLNKNIHYYNRYVKFISYYKENNVISTTYEYHHIIPKSLGGTNDVDNIVQLPTRAHLIAHLLLWKAFPSCTQMSFAIHQMTTRTGNIAKSSRIYESIKQAHSTACTIRNTGRVLPTEWKDAIRDGHKQYDHAHLKTDEARERARVKAKTILNSSEVISQRTQTLKNKGDAHASKRKEVRGKIGKSHQSIRVNAISPTGEIFVDIYITEFTEKTKISKFMIKKYIDFGKIPPPPQPFLSRWEKYHAPTDEGRIIATGWEFKTFFPDEQVPL